MILSNDGKIDKPDTKNESPSKTSPNLPIPRKAHCKKKEKDDLTWADENLNWSGHDMVKVINDEDSDMIVAGKFAK